MDDPTRWRETAACREALEQERDAFEQEAARFTALGMQTQQRSEEAARAKEAAAQLRLAAETQHRETEALMRQLAVGNDSTTALENPRLAKAWFPCACIHYSLKCLNVMPSSPKLTQVHTSSPKLALAHPSSPKLFGSSCPPSLEVRQKALEEQHVRTSTDQKGLEDERKGITKERVALGEDRLRTSRAADAVRAMQLRVSEHFSGVGTAPMSDSELRGLDGLLEGAVVGGCSSIGGVGLGDGAMEMLRKVLRDVHNNAQSGDQRRGSGSDGEERSKRSSQKASKHHSAGIAAQNEFLAGLRISTVQRTSGASPGGGVIWHAPPSWPKATVDAGVSNRHSIISNTSSAQFTNLTSVSASGDVNGSHTSENDSSDPDPVV